MTSEHARLSPSSRHRWRKDACPGSAREEEKYPDHVSKYALEGTFYHEIAAQCLIENVDAKDYQSLDLALEIGNHWPEPTDEGLASVQVYLDTVRDVLKRLKGELFVERKLQISTDHWGTVDAAIWSPSQNILTVIDYKHGKGVKVNVENNSQLKSYALGAWNIVNDKYNVQEVELVIVQPRAGGEPVKRWSVDQDTFLCWIDELDWDIEAALDPNAPLNPGSWCKFCKAAPNCEALKEQSLITAQEDFSDLKIHPEELQGEELSKALKQVKIIETYIKAVQNQAFDVAKRGGSVPGFKLVKKRAVRKWENEKKAATILTNKGIEPFAQPKMKSPAVIEKEAGDKEITRKLVVAESGGLTLVPESDRRPAVASSAEDDFF